MSKIHATFWSVSAGALLAQGRLPRRDARIKIGADLHRMQAISGDNFETLQSMFLSSQSSLSCDSLDTETGLRGSVTNPNFSGRFCQDLFVISLYRTYPPLCITCCRDEYLIHLHACIEVISRLASNSRPLVPKNRSAHPNSFWTSAPDQLLDSIPEDWRTRQ